MKIDVDSLKTFFAILAVATTITACKAGPKSDSTSSGSTSDSPALGVVDDTAGFYVTHRTNPSYTYITHKGTGVSTDDFTSKCKVSSTDSDKDIFCVVEAKEFDLFFNGVDIQYNVPSSMCDYVTVAAPYYYNFQPGVGPAAVIVNNGTVVNDAVPVGGLSVDGVIKAALYCPYDYSNANNPNGFEGGPNCCSGGYSLKTWTAPSGAGNPDSATITSEKWGGNVANCLGGPATTINKLDKYGYPTRDVYYVQGKGINQSYSVKSPISMGLVSNVYASNYFAAADHPGSAGVPISTAAGTGYSATNRYHEVSCYDRAKTLNARIRVLVREWNLVAEYDKGVTGDADSTGNDFYDFKDFGTSFPSGL